MNSRNSLLPLSLALLLSPACGEKDTGPEETDTEETDTEESGDTGEAAYWDSIGEVVAAALPAAP